MKYHNILNMSKSPNFSVNIDEKKYSIKSMNQIMQTFLPKLIDSSSKCLDQSFNGLFKVVNNFVHLTTLCSFHITLIWHNMVSHIDKCQITILKKNIILNYHQSCDIHNDMKCHTKSTRNFEIMMHSLKMPNSFKIVHFMFYN